MSKFIRAARHRGWGGVAAAGVVLSAVVLVSVAATAARPAPARIAYISLQRVASQSTAAVAAAKRIQAFRDDRTRQIAEKQRAIEAIRLRIANLGGMFQSSKRADARREEATAISELQKLEQQSQTQLQTMQRDAQHEFQQDLATVISDLVKTRGADIVLNQDTSIVWAPSALDWTDDVTRAVNARHPAPK